MNELPPEQTIILRKARLKHDGGMLAPELEQEQQAKLTDALGALKLAL